jgi:hypothetical protein
MVVWVMTFNVVVSVLSTVLLSEIAPVSESSVTNSMFTVQMSQ